MSGQGTMNGHGTMNRGFWRELNQQLPMWRPQKAWILAGLMGFALLSGCAQPPVPEDHFYRLGVEEPTNRLAVPLLDGVVEVPPFLADGVTAQREIVYSNGDKPNELQKYHYHYWTEPPTVMLRDQMIGYLRAANVAKMLVTPEMRASSDYVLSGHIVRLERVIATPPGVLLELELGLRKSRGGKMIHLKVYREETTAEAAGVSGAVDALDLALGRIYAKFLADVKAAKYTVAK